MNVAAGIYLACTSVHFGGGPFELTRGIRKTGIRRHDKYE
jgi:hypothetical protein